MWKRIRILILLLVLLFRLRSTPTSSASIPPSGMFRCALPFPINADGSAVTQRYIDSLDSDRFTAVEAFFSCQAALYGVKLDKPFRFKLGAIDRGVAAVYRGRRRTIEHSHARHPTCC